VRQSACKNNGTGGDEELGQKKKCNSAQALIVARCEQCYCTVLGNRVGGGGGGGVGHLLKRTVVVLSTHGSSGIAVAISEQVATSQSARSEAWIGLRAWRLLRAATAVRRRGRRVLPFGKSF
jgi:hypothetical protein